MLPFVAARGEYVLHRVGESHYLLSGPDTAYSTAWVMAQIGPGDWFTEWAGSGDELHVHFTKW